MKASCVTELVNECDATDVTYSAVTFYLHGLNNGQRTTTS